MRREVFPYVESVHAAEHPWPIALTGRVMLGKQHWKCGSCSFEWDVITLRGVGGEAEHLAMTLWKNIL